MALPNRLKHLVPAALLLVALQFLVFSPVVHYQFLKYDDDVYVYENTKIQKLTAESVAWMFAKPHYRSYTPLTLLSHAVDYKLFGASPWGHHLSNVVIHSMNTVLVFLFGLMLIRRFRLMDHPDRPQFSGAQADPPDTPAIIGAFVAAALFSLHPTRVESVAWVSDRKDLLFALFTLPSCMAYLRYTTLRGTQPAILWYLVSFVFFILAVLSKSIAVVLPAVLILFDLLIHRRPRGGTTWQQLIFEKVPFLMVSGAFSILAINAARGSQLSDIVMKFTPLQNALHPFYSIMFYPAKLLWPLHLTPVYPPPGEMLMIAAAVICIGLTVMAIVAASKGHTWWLLAWASYGITLLPTITGLSAGIQPWADRYGYLPTVSLMLLLGGGIATLWDESRVRGILPRGVVVTLCLTPLAISGMLSRQQLPVWQNGEALWSHAIAEAPALPMPYANLGVVRESNGDHDGALQLYAKAVELEPHYADALYNMGVAFEAKGLPDSAVVYYSRAIAADTTYDDAFINLGNILVRAGRLDDGIRLFEQAIAIDGSEPDPYFNMGIAVYTKGDRERALELFEATIERSPEYANAYHNMGVVYLDLGNGESALECFRRAARLGMPESQKLLQSQGYSW